MIYRSHSLPSQQEIVHLHLYCVAIINSNHEKRQQLWQRAWRFVALSRFLQPKDGIRQWQRDVYPDFFENPRLLLQAPLTDLRAFVSASYYRYEGSDRPNISRHSPQLLMLEKALRRQIKAASNS